MSCPIGVWRTLSEAGTAAAEDFLLKIRDQHNRIVPSFETNTVPFREHDEQVIASINQRWYDLLAGPILPAGRTGTVTLEFRLGYNERVSNLKVVGSTVDDNRRRPVRPLVE